VKWKSSIDAQHAALSLPAIASHQCHDAIAATALGLAHRAIGLVHHRAVMRAASAGAPVILRAATPLDTVNAMRPPCSSGKRIQAEESSVGILSAILSLA
jgi:hypothetical protein